MLQMQEKFKGFNYFCVSSFVTSFSLICIFTIPIVCAGGVKRKTFHSLLFTHCPPVQFVPTGNESNSYSHVLTVSHHDVEHAEEEKLLPMFFLFDAHIGVSVRNHVVQTLYSKTRQLPSSTASVICRTVNQSLK